MQKKWLHYGVLAMALMWVQTSMAAQVNVYSARKEALIKPVLDAFTQQTGIEVKLLTGKADALLTRLQVEGQYSPADMLITVDAGRLHRAKVAKVLQPIPATPWFASVPAELRDEQNYWLGLTMRARPIMYAKGRLSAEELAQLNTYEDLANPQWQGRLCLRSSDSIYNQSLVAATIHAIGEDSTQQWLQGMIANLAKPIAGGDTDQIKSLAAGECDVTIANTYYLGRLHNSQRADEQAIAQQVQVLWPNQQGRGAHFNVSGAAITKHAKNIAEANALLAFMVSEEAQRIYADINNEYPVLEGVPSASVLASFGQAKRDPIALQILGENNNRAVKLMDAVGWR